MGHTYSSILIHVIFSTKDRRLSIRDAIRPRLLEYLAGVARKEFGRAIRIGGTDDHVHALLSVRPDISFSQAMCKWKSLSSGWVHRTFPESADFAWQEGYAAFSVSQSSSAAAVRYIERQAEHHKKLTFQEELTAFLERHGIEHDSERVRD